MYPKSIDIAATGQKIKELRKERKLSVPEVTSELGLSAPQTIYKWERGDSLPSIDNIILLAELFKVSPCDIIQVR